MSADQTTTKQLIETLQDGRDGFAKGAERLAEDNAPELAATFRSFGEQRAEFLRELQQLAAQYGDDLEASGSLAAKVHRGWLSVKDALAGSDPKGVLDAAEQGEDHAVKEYQDALSADISPELRTVVERQFSDIKSAHDEVRRLRSAAS